MAEQESYFLKTGAIWTVEVDDLVVLACVLMGRRQKRSSNFLGEEKCISQEILATSPMYLRPDTRCISVHDYGACHCGFSSLSFPVAHFKSRRVV